MKRSTKGKSGVGGRRLRLLLLLPAVLACADRLPDDPAVELRWILNGWSPAWSPSGKHLLFNQVETDQGLDVERLWIVPLTGGEARRLTSVGEIGVERNGCWLPSLEKDEYLFVFESTGSYQIRSGSPDSDKTTFHYQIGSPIERVAGDADGSVVVFTRSGSAGIWRVVVSEKRAELIKNKNGWRNPRYPCVEPDGRKVRYVDSDENGADNIYRIDINGGEPTRLTSLSDGAIDDLAVAADQSLAAFIRVNPSPIQNVSLVYRMSIDDPSLVEPIEIGTYHAPQSITLSPDGRYLAYDNLENYIRIIPVDGKAEP